MILAIIFLIKCSDMETKWLVKCEPAGPGNYRINGIASLRKHSYVVASTFWPIDEQPRCITADYDENGDLIWYTPYITKGIRASKAIAVRAFPSGIIDVTHDIYVLAQTTDPIGVERVVLIKYDSLGNANWDKIIEKSKDEITSTLLNDQLNNIYIAGWSKHVRVPADIFIAKYRPSGECVWINNFQDPSIEFDSLIFALNNNGQFLIAGYLIDHEDFFYMIYDSLGKLINIKKCVTPVQEILLTDAQIDDHRNIYLLGGSYSDSSGSDYYIAVYDNNDSLIFEEAYDGPAHLEDIATNVIVEELSPESLYIYIVGSSENEDSCSEVRTVKYDIAGNELWTKTLKGRKNEPAIPCLCGPLKIHARTGQDVEYFYIAGSLGDDIFIIKHSTRGFITWFTRYSTPDALNRLTAFSGYGFAIESRTENTIDAYLGKFGKSEQFGIIRWD